MYLQVINGYSPSPKYGVLTIDGNQSSHLKKVFDRTLIGKLPERLSFLVNVFDHINEAVLITDNHFRIQYINENFTKMSGYKMDELSEQLPSIFKSGKHDNNFYKTMYQSIFKDELWHGIMLNKHKSGSIYETSVQINAVRDINNNITHYIAFYKYSDQIISESNQQNKSVQWIKERHEIIENLNKTVKSASVYDHKMAFLFIGLDFYKYKVIHETLGKDSLNTVSQIAMQRIQSNLRSNDLTFQWSKEEFLVVLQNISHAESVSDVSDRILNSLSQPFLIEEHNFQIKASAGISVYPEDSKDVETLLTKADLAMYHALKVGSNRFEYYSKSINTSFFKMVKTESRLHKALEKEEFFLRYQPQISLSTGEITGIEALITWNDTENKKIVPPNDFIKIAEETGLIVPMGEWVIKTACTQHKEWQSLDLLNVPVAVNISAQQLHQKDFHKRLEDILSETSMDPSLLELELTESMLINQEEFIYKSLKQFKDKGIHISIDDFGTGYSSLNYLKRFPISKLKIDRSFIKDISHNSEDYAIVNAIITMSETLNIKVIAEGVEREDQINTLKSIHCHSIQGYYHCQPLPANELINYIKKIKK